MSVVEKIVQFDSRAGWNNVKRNLPDGARRFRVDWGVHGTPGKDLGWDEYQRGEHSFLFDHPYSYICPRRGKVFAAEPYEISGWEVVALTKLTAAGWTVRITSNSRWFHGTTLIEMWRHADS